MSDKYFTGLFYSNIFFSKSTRSLIEMKKNIGFNSNCLERTGLKFTNAI